MRILILAEKQLPITIKNFFQIHYIFVLFFDTIYIKINQFFNLSGLGSIPKR
jgi:hypothetical protein